MPERRRKDLPECWAGECLPDVGEIRRRFDYVKGIKSRTGGKTFHVIEAQGGYYAFVEIDGKFYATSNYPSLETLEGYIF